MLSSYCHGRFTGTMTLNGTLGPGVRSASMRQRWQTMIIWYRPRLRAAVSAGRPSACAASTMCAAKRVCGSSTRYWSRRCGSHPASRKVLNADEGE